MPAAPSVASPAVAPPARRRRRGLAAFSQRLFRPEFLYRPPQALRAARGRLLGDPQGVAICRLPWGLPVGVVAGDYIGHRVLRHGLTALTACETAFRLLDPGDAAADVGANYGVVTAAMAAAVGPRGAVTAVEMHPRTFQALADNVRRWEGMRAAPVRLVNAAASDEPGEITAFESEGFEGNSGVGYVSRGEPGGTTRKLTVPAERLDETLADGAPPKFLKLDVERHELPALRGAGALVAERAITHLLVEDVRGPSPVKSLLTDAGYTLLSIDCRPLRPVLSAWDASATGTGAEDVLATTDPDDAARRFAGGGYRCLRGRRS